MFAFARALSVSRSLSSVPMVMPRSSSFSAPPQEPLPADASALTPDDIESRFAYLLEFTLMIPTDAREKMIRELNVGQKWTFLAQQERRNSSSMREKAAGNVKSSPEYMIGQLNAKPSAEVYRALRVCISTEPVAWLQAFADKSGIELLVQSVIANEKVKEKTADINEMIYEGLGCVISMSHSGDGLSLVLTALVDCDLLKSLVLCLDTRDSRVKIYLYDFLSLLCALGPSYYDIVMEAMDSYRYVKHEPSKFLHLVDTLRFDGDAPKSHCLQFINALISTSEDLDRRAVTRALFTRLGIADVLDRLSRTLNSDEQFMVHYNTFMEEELADKMAEEEIRKELAEELEKHQKPKLGFSYTSEATEKQSDLDLLQKRMELHSALEPHLLGIGKV